MKILIACNTDSYRNPYVRTLYEGLLQQECDVTCSIKDFWHNAIYYDIIHIQWPNLLVDKFDTKCKRLAGIISSMKKSGKTLICTCHNIKPHYNDGEAINNTYRIIYENCDVIIHLGPKSIELLQKAYPSINAQHIVIPHHTYDTIYDMNLSKETARRKLNIPQNKRVIMSFGSFRNDEERNLIINLRKELSGDEYFFLMPGFYRGNLLRKNIIKGIDTLLKTFKYSWIAKKHGLHIQHKFVSDEHLPYYIAAADIMLIQRVEILNSGNVPLAMLAGLPVVGPNKGNVGSFLQETGNYVFDTNNLSSLSTIVRQALNDKFLGKRNKEYAEKYLTTKKISFELKKLYELVAK